MAKKFLSILLSLVLVLSLAACGGEQEEEQAGGERGSSVGDSTSEGVEGGKRKWLPPVGTGGALWGTAPPDRRGKT